MRRACWILLVACGHAPPPAAKSAERPARTAADIAGKWVTSDDMDWGYHMYIDAKGTIDVWIDRGKIGRCEQKGTIAPGKAAGEFRLVYTIGQCNPQAVNIPIDATIPSFTGSSLTILVGDDRRVYERAPEQRDDDNDRPSVLLKH